MVLNNAILGKTTCKDRRLFERVMLINLDTRNYMMSLKRSVRRKLPAFECHTICRAIARHIPKLKVVDGHYVGISFRTYKKMTMTYLKYCDHSWLTTPTGVIIDPYPVGLLTTNPVLVVNRGEYKSFGGNLYRPDKKVTKKVYTQKLRKKVKVLSQIISEVIKHARRSGHS